jgi:hypothetical protein
MPTKTPIMERNYNAPHVASTAPPMLALDFYYTISFRNVTEPLDETRSIEMDTDLYQRVLARIETVGDWVTVDEALGQLADNA